MHRFLVFIALLSLYDAGTANSQTLQTLMVEFERVVVSDSSADSARGVIYYRAPGDIVLRVIEPVDQWMVFEGHALILYYPASRQAFRFTSDNPFSLPFFQAFLGLADSEVGLTAAGFTLEKNEIKNDTLIIWWMPPEIAKKALGSTVVRLVGDRMISLEARSPKGRVLARTTYGTHVRHGGAYFPLEVTAEQFEDGRQAIESVVFTKPQFNVALPQEVTNFRLPADVEPMEIQW